MSELERALVALGRDLEVPDVPDVRAAVAERLEPRAARRGRPVVLRRRWVAAVALAVLAAVGATLAVPDARSALFRVLHLGAERVEFVEELPPVPVEPAGLELALGERIGLEDARRRSGFALRELAEAPDRVYAGERGTIWFLYGSPESVRLLVAQTAHLSVDEGLVSKKLLTGGTQVEEVSIDGVRGYFLHGEPHVVLLLDELGNPVEETARLAANVLIWEEEGIAFRLEGDFDRDDAVRLARSLR